MDVSSRNVGEDHNINHDKFIKIATNIKTGDAATDNDDTLSLTVAGNGNGSLAGAQLYIYNMSTHKYEAVGTYDSKTDTWKLDSDDLSYVTYKLGLSLPLFIQPAENSNVDLNLKLTLTATDPDGSTKDTVENAKIGITSVADNATVDFGAQTGARANISGKTIDKSSSVKDEIIYGGSGVDNIRGGSGNDIIHGDSSKYEVSIGIKQMLTDNDGSETIQLKITGDDIPTGATVVGGVKQADGSWTITLAKGQTELKFELDGNGEKSFDIKVQTRTIDHDIDTNTSTTGNWDTEQPLTVKVDARTNDGNDTIDGGKGDDTIYGEGGDDTIDGGDGDDKLWGGSGVDTIKGGAGSDTIDGGAGDDKLWGGAGNDTFAFNKDSGNDTINDFDLNNDKISIGNNDKIGVTQSNGDIKITFMDDKGNVTGDSVTIKNITIDDGADNKFSFNEVKDLFKDLDSSDFIPE